ncbi:hypothetical protein N1E92_31625, partial [Pseudomonas aeruginosa]|nr:hypothetical protein [Pseudomonas aeruginosa]
LHGKKWGAQHPGTDRSVEGGVYGAVTFLFASSNAGLTWPFWGSILPDISHKAYCGKASARMPTSSVLILIFPPLIFLQRS